MSESSSGESSDDSILASPVFKKRDRRTERASKSKLSFLDACLNGTNARTDAQRRLAEVESEHVMDTEEQNNLEEEETSPPKSQNNDATDAIETKETDTIHEADNDSDGSVKRNKVVTITAPLKTASRAPLKSDQQSEEDYWDRVESFNSTNKAKMNVGIDADRGKLSDAMNGLDDYTSETDDEDGKWNDGMGGMTREQMRSEARAKLQGLSASMGLRTMFQQTTTKPTTCVYDNKVEAINELKLIASTLQKRHRNENGESEAILRRQMLDPLNKVFKNPKDLIWGLLLRFLQRNTIITGTCEERVILPKCICQWMWNATCSSFDAMGHVSTACCQNLVKMIVNEMYIDDDTSFSADLTFIETYSIVDLVSHLENECGLWLVPGPMSSDDENIDHDAGKASPVDVYAMKNIFLLWKAALDRDLIKLDTDNGAATRFEGASKAVTALTRVGIDPIFNLANENTKNCIDTVPQLLQSLMASLINSTVRQISKLHSESDAKKWIKHTADRMVEACSNLSAGEEGDADHDDDDGWLPLACAVERMIDFEYGDDEHSLDVVEVKLNFARIALERCLAEEDDTSDRENQLKQATTRLEDLVIRDDSDDATKRLLEMAMHALTHAEISLQYIDKNSDAFMRDHPHLLAAILLSGECAFLGTHVSKQIEVRNLQLEIEEKDALVEFMSIIETTCNNIKKKCTSVIAYPHLRRVKEYLTRLGKTVGGMKGKASSKRHKVRHQGSLDSWRRASLPETQDTMFEFSQDSNCSSQGFLESQD